MTTLHLTLKKKWFDMILSGEKKEEYREIKDYWTKRLVCCASPMIYNKFYTITFKNGYSAKAPEIVVKLKSIKMGYGKESWGAQFGTSYYVLSLGEIISTKNLNP